jgi:hypothetical protein
MQLIRILTALVLVVSQTTTSSGAESSAAEKPVASRPSAPADVARRLFRSWQKGDERGAREVASDAAIRALFKGTPAGMEFQGCEHEARAYSCSFYVEGGGLVMTVNGSPTTGYRVDAIEFLAD